MTLRTDTATRQWIDRYYTEMINLRRHRPRQHSDVIHKPLDQVLVLVLRVARHGELALTADFGRGDFDFEFVFEVGFCRWLFFDVRLEYGGCVMESR